MALLPSEVIRLKYELQYNVLGIGAEPYIGQTALFDQVIVPYLNSGATTTSSTAVTASTTPASTTLTLTSPTGFLLLARVIVDVDDAQEAATVQSITGSTIVVRLSKAHTGTYPVTVEGGESLVRELLTKLRNVSAMIDGALSFAGLKSVDKGDVEFFGKAEGGTTLSALEGARSYYRRELRSLLFGVGRRSNNGRTELY